MSWRAAWERLGYLWTHPANRGARLRALGRAAAWQVSKRTWGRPWDLKLYGAARLRCYPNSQAAVLALYTHGWPDWHEMHFLSDLLRPGDAFLDVGANVGLYTLLAASSVGASGRIEAFEPAPKARQMLLECVQLNGLHQVHVHSYAVTSHSGRVPFVECGATSRIAVVGTSSLDCTPRPDSRCGADPQEAESLVDKTVDCVTLDDTVSGVSFRAGKLDIEGAEPAALAGATRMLAAGNPPVWIVEMNGRLRDFGYCEERFAEWLGDHGYDLGLYDADARRLDMVPQPWRDRDNVLAVARGSLREIRAQLASSRGS